MFRKEYIRIEYSTQHSSVNDFVVIDMPKEDVEPKQIILDPDDQPMWESAKTVAPTPNSVIIQLDVDDNFVINSTHLNMIRENKFDGYLRADPHDHIREFLAICNMFRYDKTQSEAVKLLIFPFSLYDKAKTWFNELNEESITSWEQMRKAFINKFFPPSLFNHLLLEIINFSQLTDEKKLEEIPIIHNFPKVFSDDLLGLNFAREVEFCIDLTPRAMPMARSLYRLAPSEMQELDK
ncbi:reverse transcriptase domain-containing protein [Tanacetum coccineum]